MARRPGSLVDAASREFEIAWYEMALAREPNNLAAIDQLAHAYTAVGRYQDGLAMDRKLVAALPDTPIVHYNLACSLSLIGQLDEAVDALIKTVQLGYDEFDHMMQDPDLTAVRQYKRFEEVIDVIADMNEGSEEDDEAGAAEEEIADEDSAEEDDENPEEDF